MYHNRGQTEQSRAEQSRAEQSRAEQSGAEQSRAEQSRAEQNRTEQNRTEQNKTKQNKTKLMVLGSFPEKFSFGIFFSLQHGYRSNTIRLMVNYVSSPHVKVIHDEILVSNLR